MSMSTGTADFDDGPSRAEPMSSTVFVRRCGFPSARKESYSRCSTVVALFHERLSAGMHSDSAEVFLTEPPIGGGVDCHAS